MTPEQELLSKAADRIERVGLAKGTWVNTRVNGEERSPDVSPCCTMGAISLELHPEIASPNFLPDPYRSAARRAEALLVAQLGLASQPNGFADIVEWSDNHTQEEVVAALRSAAAA